MQQRVHPALGLPDPPALLDPPPDLGRRPEPPGRHFVGQLRLLVRHQERRRPLAAGMTPLDRRQPTGPVPRQPALHRPLVHPEHRGRLARRVPSSHQPQRVQSRPHVGPPLAPIPPIQARRVIPRRPLHPQLPSPPCHPFLSPACCPNYTAGLGGIGIISVRLPL